ncbi:MAG: 4-alpha-glucanotransferase [Oscillospiraceae bacterium]
MRSSGILMHISSLPSPYGIGTMGREARAFAEFLAAAGQTYWQILPICPTSFGDSPYQSFSTYAGNPYLIDPEDLERDGLLRPEEYKNQDWGDPGRVDYGLLYQKRYPMLRLAADRFLQNPAPEFMQFCRANAFWLDPYALFMALKEHHGGAPWQDWEEPLRNRNQQALMQAESDLSGEISFWRVVQFLFFRQWNGLKRYANDRGISIIGDLPIYVSGDSVEVWTDPQQFQLDKNLLPTEVAGCPPDGFSAQGQLWGNPLFDWDYMAQDGYKWWIRRIAYQCKIYDVLRIDHFRGFDTYYAIPYGDKTAQNGRWRQGPGAELFAAVEQVLGKQHIIAEDLGFLTPTVHALRDATGFPGMKVLEFAFDSRDGSGSVYLPHNYPENCVVYTGAHDNDTILGWMESATPEDVAYAKKYLHLTPAEGYHWGMMRAAWESVADTAVVQMQDLLGLGSEGRMNVPSTVGENWKWRAPQGFASPQLAQRLRQETETYHRLPCTAKI